VVTKDEIELHECSSENYMPPEASMVAPVI